MEICRWATLSRRTRLEHSGSSWSNVHNRACSTSPNFRPAQKDGHEPSSKLRWIGANCMTSSSLTYIAGGSLHSRPYGAMAIFTPSKISLLAPKAQNRIGSPYQLLQVLVAAQCRAVLWDAASTGRDR